MKEITLTKSLSAIVDDEDFETLSVFSWYAHNGNGAIYAVRNSRTWNSGVRHTIRMHRVIVGAAPGEVVDHINGNTLDNRRANLRRCTHTGNSINRKLGKNNSSGYRGVSHDRRYGTWRASIRADRKQISLGCFATPEEAAMAYDRAAAVFHGAFARFNFAHVLEVAGVK
jgi:hypothetical protein